MDEFRLLIVKTFMLWAVFFCRCVIPQEEVGELKAELRKAMSEAKNVERRMSAGRRGVSGGAAFGFKAKGGDVGGVAPGKSVPHTPSKKLSEAKNR